LSFDVIDEIFVYNLGMDNDTISCLNTIKKVKVKEFPEEIKDIYEGKKYMQPKQYAWKMFCILDGSKYAQNVLWVDSGQMFLGCIDVIFNEIEKSDIFLVDNKYWKTGDHLSSSCANVMKVTKEEKQSPMINASIIGYKSDGKYQEKFINAGFEWSKIREAIFGSFADHRHDQTIYSVLATRCGLANNLHDVFIYANWNHPGKLKGQMTFHHRASHFYEEGLMFKEQ